MTFPMPPRGQFFAKPIGVRVIQFTRQLAGDIALGGESPAFILMDRPTDQDLRVGNGSEKPRFFVKNFDGGRTCLNIGDYLVELYGNVWVPFPMGIFPDLFTTAPKTEERPD